MLSAGLRRAGPASLTALRPAGAAVTRLQPQRFYSNDKDQSNTQVQRRDNRDGMYPCVISLIISLFLDSNCETNSRWARDVSILRDPSDGALPCGTE